MSFPSPPSPLSVARAYLGGHLRLTLSDKRVVSGRLHCLDWKANLILSDALLERPVASGSNASSVPPGRFNLVAVQLSDVISCEASAEEWADATARAAKGNDTA